MGLQRKPDTEDLLIMGGISLGLHILLVIFLSLNPWPVIIKVKPNAYTVTLVPVSIPEPEPRVKQPPVPKVEEKKKQKPITKPKKDDIVEKVKKSPKKVEKPEEKKVDLKHLHEALEEIRKKIALDEIQKKIARREKTEAQPTATPPVPVVSSTRSSDEVEMLLSRYYSLIWGKIKQAWTIPEHLLKERVDLESIIIVIIKKDGQIANTWFEKTSGNDLYDQMAMRAIKKAEPLPPIPKELGKDTLEIGIRFFPD